MTAVDGVSFEVRRGEIVGLLGPNGAGKTTTINVILGVLDPTAGAVRIAGERSCGEPLTGAGAHQFRGRLRAAAGKSDGGGEPALFRHDLRSEGSCRGRIEELLKQFELERFRGVKCGVLSSGEQTRVSLAKAMLNRPQLLLLDEPTASLDPATAARHPRDHPRVRSRTTAAACCGPRTTCMRWRKCATGCCSCRAERFCWKAIRRRCRGEHGKATWKSCSSPSRASRWRWYQRSMSLTPHASPSCCANTILLRGSPTRVLPLFVWVAIDIVLWGFITRYLNSVASSGINFVPALLGAVLLWDFFVRVMQGVTTAFFEDVWSRSLLNVFATPHKDS